MALANRMPPTAEEIEEYPKRFSNWGRWGPDDQLGTLNHITPEVQRAAGALIREGRTVSLGRQLDKRPGPRNPFPARHHMVMVNDELATDYIAIACHGHSTTHLDALCHMFTDGKMYNGYPASDVKFTGARNGGVQEWRNGIVTRGVVYDIPRLRGKPYLEPGEPVQGWELQDAAEAQGIEPRPGDAVLIRVGRDPYDAANPNAPPGPPSPQMGGAGIPPLAGVAPSVTEFLYETSAALCGADSNPPHDVTLTHMGLPLLDAADLEAVAAICAELERWEFCFMMAPLIIRGGTGSPVNPIAVF